MSLLALSRYEVKEEERQTESVRNMTRLDMKKRESSVQVLVNRVRRGLAYRSIPSPHPPVGGRPCSRASIYNGGIKNE